MGSLGKSLPRHEEKWSWELSDALPALAFLNFLLTFVLFAKQTKFFVDDFRFT